LPLSTSSSILSDREEIWDDFRKYLINEGQRRHSVRNKVGYAKKFYYILEKKHTRPSKTVSWFKGS